MRRGHLHWKILLVKEISGELLQTFKILKGLQGITEEDLFEQDKLFRSILLHRSDEGPQFSTYQPFATTTTRHLKIKAGFIE